MCFHASKNSLFTLGKDIPKERSPFQNCASGGFLERNWEIRPPVMWDSVTRPANFCYSSLIGLDCAYGLRYVELNNRGKAEPWSIRQTAIYHKYKPDTKSSTWIMVSASPNTRRVLERYISSSEDLASLKAFELHLLMIDAALANWPQYIMDLTDNISGQVSQSFHFVQFQEPHLLQE